MALAGSTAFAAVLPLAGARHVPGIVRAALALSIAPLAADSATIDTAWAATGGGVTIPACIAAATGTSVGLTASIIAGSAASAGALFDQALAGGPASSNDASQQGSGPFSVLLPLVAANAWCGSGALGWLVAGFAGHFTALAVHATAAGAVDAIRTAFHLTLALALPPVFAHAVATLIAGLASRVAPRVNGMLLTPAIASPLALIVAIVGVPATFALMRHMVAIAAHAALHT
ncbi:MAG TPA: flagellar biosynthetic protein FliR [Candidatus Eremiobacteraceae bacterium]|nr:flagellar biosynthetic protein FliR [Candidatus Eremiobacteraceae bacterium]